MKDQLIRQTIMTTQEEGKKMTELIDGKECPRCGNMDIIDDFTIMICSQCGNSYMSYLARDCKIEI